MIAMPVSSRRVSGGFLAAAACCGMLASFGPPSKGRGSQVQPAKPRPYVFGAQFCSDCHGHPENYAGQLGEMICNMDEYRNWHDRDRHEYSFHWSMNIPPDRRNAKDERHQNGARFLLLAGQRAQAIVDRLQIKDLRRSACVNCHGLAVPKDVPVDRFVQNTDGVTCVACHGAYQDWALRHQAVNDPQWRKLTRKEKERDYGMVDLWNPVIHASKCLSCHIGNADEQKVITHSMYAAGHPALPGIEVASFGDQEPRHWRFLREKPEPIQQLLGFNRRRMEQTELVAISAIVALRESMKLFVAGFKMAGPSGRTPAVWPEFARYDCYACHHELQASGPPLAGNRWRNPERSAGPRLLSGRKCSSAWESKRQIRRPPRSDLPRSKACSGNSTRHSGLSRSATGNAPAELRWKSLNGSIRF